MILDGLLLLSGAVSATNVLTPQTVNGAGSFLSSNTIDVAPLLLGGNQAGDMGAGENVYVEVSVVTAPTAGTSVAFELVQADDAAITSNVQVISATGTYTIAQLPAGTIIGLRWSPSPLAPKRYVALRYVNTGAIATASYTAAVVKDIQSTRLYFKSGFTVT